MAIALVLPSFLNCSSSKSVAEQASSTTSGKGGSGGDSTTTGPAGTGGNIFQGSGGCMAGSACEGGLCTNTGDCCAEENYCAGECCSNDDICSFQKCVLPGKLCIDASDCLPSEYCEYALGDNMNQGSGGSGGANTCMGGVQLQNGKCLPRPPECGPGEDPGDPPKCLQKCEYKPPTGQFNPEEKYSWGDVSNSNHDVMMAPIVVQLDDDNCDMKIDERDIPDIVFFTFAGGDYNNNAGTSATLRAISIIGGQVIEKWATKTSQDHPGRSIAGGDIHPSPGNEIVVCTRDQRVRAYDASGKVLWTSSSIGQACFMPSIADMDQDGSPEVVVKSAILDGATGNIKQAINNSSHVVVSDVNGDGFLDIVGPSIAFDKDGNILADPALAGTHPAVGDLDKDGRPEIITINRSANQLHVWHVDNTLPNKYAVVRSDININGDISPNPCCQQNPNSAGCKGGGGPPTIADFNGDGFPDVGLAGGIGYAVFDGKKLMDSTVANKDTLLWITQTQDCSSAQTGSSVFDFDGDGKAEVVYGDEVSLHVYSGVDGSELFNTCNTTGTLFEYPLVADVDSDGHADIVVASNSYSSLNCSGKKTTGIRIFGDTQGKWVRTRRIWNQHAYHVTNVNEDGSIPAVEAANFLDPKLNNFRQNVQPQGEFSAPDLVVSVQPLCGENKGLIGRVRNIGAASVPPGVTVSFYEGAPGMGTLVGEAQTKQTLYSLGSEDVILNLQSLPTGQVYAVVAESGGPYPWRECREDNNSSKATTLNCGPK